MWAQRVMPRTAPAISRENRLANTAEKVSWRERERQHKVRLKTEKSSIKLYLIITLNNYTELLKFVNTGWPKKRNSRFFRTLLWSTLLSIFTLLNRAYFPYYNNTKIIKFGWELFILWVISYGLSFWGFAIDLSLIVPRNSGNRANPESDNP